MLEMKMEMETKIEPDRAPINPLAYVHVHTGIETELEADRRWMN